MAEQVFGFCCVLYIQGCRTLSFMCSLESRNLDWNESDEWIRRNVIQNLRYLQGSHSTAWMSELIRMSGLEKSLVVNALPFAHRTSALYNIKGGDKAGVTMRPPFADNGKIYLNSEFFGDQIKYSPGKLRKGLGVKIESSAKSTSALWHMRGRCLKLWFHLSFVIGASRVMYIFCVGWHQTKEATST